MSDTEELSIRIRQRPIYDDVNDPTLAELVGHARNMASRCDRVQISRGGRIIAVVRWIDRRSTLIRVRATKRDREDRQRFENFEAVAAKRLAGPPPIATVEYGSERWEIRGDPGGMILFVDGQRVYPNRPDARSFDAITLEWIGDIVRRKGDPEKSMNEIAFVLGCPNHGAPPPKADNES